MVSWLSSFSSITLTRDDGDVSQADRHATSASTEGQKEKDEEKEKANSKEYLAPFYVAAVLHSPIGRKNLNKSMP